MSATVHRIEALPGDGRFAVTFRVASGGDQGAVAEVRGDAVTLPESSLPSGWSPDTPAHAALTRAVLALHEARAIERVEGTLVDVDGGWDVGLGNVVPGADGSPQCVAHGPMEPDGPAARHRFRCPECGAMAAVS